MTAHDIVVIGAAHLDILADYDSSREGQKDKIGSLNYSVGGTAFNIAVNLSRGCPTALVSVLKADSLFSDLIETRLEENGIITDHIKHTEHVSESGFIGLRRDGELVNAVTASGLTDAPLERERLRGAIEGTELAVVDCNLNRRQLDTVCEIANDCDVSLFACGVSESKATRVKAVNSPIDLFSLTRREAKHLFGADPLEADVDEVCEWIDDLQIETLVVTADTDGYVVFSDGNKRAFPAPEIDSIVSDSGAGDALLAGFCDVYYTTGDLCDERLEETIETYVSTVLRQEGATPGSVAREPELTMTEQFNAAVESNLGQVAQFRRRHRWIDLVAAVFSLAAAGLTFWADLL